MSHSTLYTAPSDPVRSWPSKAGQTVTVGDGPVVVVVALAELTGAALDPILAGAVVTADTSLVEWVALFETEIVKLADVAGARSSPQSQGSTAYVSHSA